MTRSVVTLHKHWIKAGRTVVAGTSLWVLLYGGCARQTLMPTPALVAQGGLNPFAKVAEGLQTATIPIFVASTRTVSGRDDPKKFYTNERSRLIRLGRATLTIGGPMTWSELVDASTAVKRKKDPVIEVVDYDEYGVLKDSVPSNLAAVDPEIQALADDPGPADHFLTDLNRMLEASRRRQITIYVHGFGTKFHRNLGTIAGFWHYMARDGVAMSFDWPSEANLLEYQTDKANAEFATRQFRLLLGFLARDASVDRINIIGHSAGCPLVIGALRDLALLHDEFDTEELRRLTRIGRVVLAAPDMDLLTTYNAGLDGAMRVPETLAIYASTRDRALLLSGWIFDADRLGASVNRLSPIERKALRRSPLQAIDVTNAQQRSGGLLGHSYYHQDSWVNSDAALLLATGALPEERGLVRDADTAFWSFPNDYEVNLPSVAEKLVNKYDKP